MKDVYYERLVIKMIDGSSYEDQANLVKDIKA